MSAPLPRALEILLDIGIIQVAPPVHSNSVLAPPIVASSVSSIDLAGSLGAGIPPISSPDQASPQQQPTLFWKAIGFCLKNSFTSSASLSNDNRALFFGDPGQAGIPGGAFCPREVTNYELFLNADTMQQVNRPTFTLKGSSYFEFLNLYSDHVLLLASASADANRYLKHVGDQNESADLVRARQALVEAKLKKDRIWEDGRAAFADERSKKSETQQSLIDYIDSDKNYKSAWEAEEISEQAFAHLRKPALRSASAQLGMIRLADMRLEPQVGNNMPVIAVDKDWAKTLLQNPQWSIKDLVDPKDVYYRPSYGLPQYETTTDYWIKANAASENQDRDGSYVIPLANIWNRSWSDLGHPLLDQAKPAESLTDEQKHFINSLSATLTFLQRPYTGNITTGLWGDIGDLRGKFPLEPDAPQSIQETVCKTSKLILAWGFKIELTVPEIFSSSSVKNITLAAMDLPLKVVAGNSNKLIFEAGGDGIPILVGALADIV